MEISNIKCPVIHVHYVRVFVNCKRVISIITNNRELEVVKKVFKKNSQDLAVRPYLEGAGPPPFLEEAGAGPFLERARAGDFFLEGTEAKSQ